MKKHDHLREKAVQLRVEKGLALDEIVERLQLPRTTVYYWIKDLPIPRTEKQSESRQRASDANSEKYRKLREAAYNEGFAQAPELIANPLFRDFIVLYMAEGYRRNRNVVSLCNSNPNIVRLADCWIRQLSGKIPTYTLQCHEDNDEEELKAFWNKELALTTEKIQVVRKSNSGELSGRQWRSIHGVLTVHVGDTYLRAKIQAWMDYLQEVWKM
ncbi:MAG: hypothetical protein H0T73_19870 [Ardenticatenales bacterium]|nr:hypothetical protein [Ardenticatenales bacterium]